MRRALILALTLSACGGDDDPPVTPGPCDEGGCLTSIDDEADWQAVSIAHTGERCDFAEETKYLAPASPGAALQTTVYQDVGEHRFHVEFMRLVLDEHFAGITPDQYATLVQERATREYWGGAIARVVDAAGTTVGYGFDVIVDQTDPAEEATEAEIEAIHALLSESFHLPLVYAPRTATAIVAAQGMDLPFDLVLPRACGVPLSCDDPGASCIVAPADLTLCGHFVDDRPIALEHERKAQVVISRGEWAIGESTLPSELTLVTTGFYGPERTQITAPTPGTIYYRPEFDLWEYHQVLQAGDETIELSTQLYGPGPVRIEYAEPALSMSYLGFHAVVGDGGGEPNDTLNLRVCDPTELDDWTLHATLAGGDSVDLAFRYREPFAASAPVIPKLATIVLGGQTIVEDDYFQLVYAGLHHNFDNQWWVIFDAPVTYDGHDVYGIWVDQMTYMQDPLDGIYTLDANLEQLDTLTVIDSSVTAD